MSELNSGVEREAVGLGRVPRSALMDMGTVGVENEGSQADKLGQSNCLRGPGNPPEYQAMNLGSS